MIKSWRMRLAGLVARTGENINAYRVLLGKPGRKSHNNAMDLREIECGVDWNRLV
jgi:hypothetical protein